MARHRRRYGRSRGVSDADSTEGVIVEPIVPVVSPKEDYPDPHKPLGMDRISDWEIKVGAFVRPMIDEWQGDREAKRKLFMERTTKSFDKRIVDLVSGLEEKLQSTEGILNPIPEQIDDLGKKLRDTNRLWETASEKINATEEQLRLYPTQNESVINDLISGYVGEAQQTTNVITGRIDILEKELQNTKEIIDIGDGHLQSHFEELEGGLRDSQKAYQEHKVRFKEEISAIDRRLMQWDKDRGLWANIRGEQAKLKEDLMQQRADIIDSEEKEERLITSTRRDITGEQEAQFKEQRKLLGEIRTRVDTRIGNLSCRLDRELLNLKTSEKFSRMKFRTAMFVLGGATIIAWAWSLLTIMNSIYS